MNLRACFLVTLIFLQTPAFSFQVTGRTFRDGESSGFSIEMNTLQIAFNTGPVVRSDGPFQRGASRLPNDLHRKLIREIEEKFVRPNFGQSPNMAILPIELNYDWTQANQGSYSGEATVKVPVLVMGSARSRKHSKFPKNLSRLGTGETNWLSGAAVISDTTNFQIVGSDLELWRASDAAQLASVKLVGTIELLSEIQIARDALSPELRQAFGAQLRNLGSRVMDRNSFDEIHMRARLHTKEGDAILIPLHVWAEDDRAEFARLFFLTWRRFISSEYYREGCGKFLDN